VVLPNGSPPAFSPLRCPVLGDRLAFEVTDAGGLGPCCHRCLSRECEPGSLVRGGTDLRRCSRRIRPVRRVRPVVVVGWVFPVAEGGFANVVTPQQDRHRFLAVRDPGSHGRSGACWRIQGDRQGRSISSRGCRRSGEGLSFRSAIRVRRGSRAPESEKTPRGQGRLRGRTAVLVGSRRSGNLPDRPLRHRSLFFERLPLPRPSESFSAGLSARPCNRFTAQPPEIWSRLVRNHLPSKPGGRGEGTDQRMECSRRFRYHRLSRGRRRRWKRISREVGEWRGGA
jgi:hypothetical protein